MTAQTNTAATATANTAKVSLLPADYDVTKSSLSDFPEMLEATVNKIVGANTDLQISAYTALYHSIHSFNKTPLTMLTNSLSNAGGMFDESRFKNIKLWVSRFFTAAYNEQLLNAKDAYKFEVSQGDFSFTAEIKITDVMEFREEKEVRKVTLPRKDTPEFEELAKFLRHYADTFAVANAANDARKDSNEKAKKDGKLTMNEKTLKAEQEKELLAKDEKDLTDAEKLEKKQLQAKQAEKLIKAVDKSLGKVVDADLQASELKNLIDAMETQLKVLTNKYQTLVSQAVGE